MDPARWTLHTVEQTISTNTLARSLVDAGATGPLVVHAWTQTSGRGRLARAWYSPPGGLTATWVMCSPVAGLARWPLLAGLAVCEACAGLYPEARPGLGLKWPNDVWLHGGKLAGVLCETILTAGAHAEPTGTANSHAVLVGIGVNVCCEPTDLPDGLSRPPAVLCPWPGDAWQARGVVADVRDAITRALMRLQAAVQDDAAWGEALDRIRGLDVLPGKLVHLDEGGRPVTGTAAGLGPEGELLVELGDGAIRSVRSGELFRVE